MQMNRYYMPFIETVEPDGCPGLVQRTLGLDPDVVVVRKHRSQSRCIRGLKRTLLERGYASSQVSFRFQQHRSFIAEPTDAKRIRWRIYFK
jgi:hypothetical protein